MKYIKIVNINQNYFKHIDFCVPKNKFIVITGPSGSGKSTLVMDIIYALGQRKFLTSLPSYVRKFIDLPDEPSVDEAIGLTPCVIIDQKTSTHNVRSTVGTVSEVYDYMRLLFASIGQLKCLSCHNKIIKKSILDIAEELQDIFMHKSLLLSLHLSKNYEQDIRFYVLQGYTVFEVSKKQYSVKNNADIVTLIDDIKSKNINNSEVFVVLYQDMVNENSLEDIVYALNTYFENESILSLINDNKLKLNYSINYTCAHCKSKIIYPSISSQLFSFNLPTGACILCKGIGYCDIAQDCQGNGFDLAEIFVKKTACKECGGKRLRREALAVSINGKSISDLCDLSIVSLKNFMINDLCYENMNNEVAKKIIKEMCRRLALIEELGIGYLSLSRASCTLSGGEMQRIRLAAQLGSGLSGVTYILDEPSIGLHQSDNVKLIEVICQLRDLGNTIFVVEHDEETMLSADIVVDIGPGAGKFGGNIVFNGSPDDLLREKKSLTAAYLNKEKFLDRNTDHFIPTSWIVLDSLSKNNLKNISVEIPINNGMIVVFSGISGSGKSTLLFDEVVPRLLHCFTKKNIIFSEMLEMNTEFAYTLKGDLSWAYSDIVLIDQKSIGLCPRSTVGTYTGFFDDIRVFYAALPESQLRGFGKGDFSFNTGRFRCEKCRGAGQIIESLYPLPDITISCNKCNGMRFCKNILSIKYNDKNIFDVLSMSVTEAVVFFKHFKKIYKKLHILLELGLGYLSLNQTIDTFSGGEKQRLKLANSLIGRQKKVIYIFDEPTTGLHFQDIAMLLKIFDHLVASGNSLFIIEHNIAIIKYADYIIDMGPGGGEYGGQVVAVGSPIALKENPQSVTGRYL